MADEKKGGELMSGLIDIGIPIASGVHKILKERGVYEKVKDFVTRKKPCEVIVLGASGTGKSSFLRYVRGIDAYIRPEIRTDKVTEVKGKIDKTLFRFIDTPGEARHAEKRKKGILDAYHAKSLGIINLVSYGYHEGAAGGKKAVEDIKPSEKYLEASRAVEIDLLAEWTSLLAGRGGPAKWLITIITKADLWWTPEQSQVVLDYYSNGPYYNALGEAKSITQSVRVFSSINQLFYGRVPMSGFYSDDQRIKDRDALIALLLEYASEQYKD
jgi:50S ribosome-binding GTPase